MGKLSAERSNMTDKFEKAQIIRKNRIAGSDFRTLSTSDLDDSLVSFILHDSSCQSRFALGISFVPFLQLVPALAIIIFVTLDTKIHSSNVFSNGPHCH